jgi:hypothetical protein
MSRFATNSAIVTLQYPLLTSSITNVQKRFAVCSLFKYPTQVNTECPRMMLNKKKTNLYREIFVVLRK